MSRAFRVTLSGQSEKLFQELNGLGLSDQDILSRALWYLKQVHRTGRVALLKREALTAEEVEAFVEVLYTVLDTEDTSRYRHPQLDVGTIAAEEALRRKGIIIERSEEHGSH
jgi:hypothetical protein